MSETSKPTIPSPKGLDLTAFRATQDQMTHVLGQKLLTTVAVKKPSKEAWVRTWDQESMWYPAWVLELKEEDTESYLVLPDVAAALSEESTISCKMLIPTISRQGSFFLWSVRLPDANGKHNIWSASALKAANTARTQWIRVLANRSSGHYEVWTTNAEIPEPTWPNMGLDEILKIAFEGKVIDNTDHPVLRKLQGR